MSTTDTKTKLPVAVRILLGIVAIPSLYLAYMVVVMAMNGDVQKVDYFEWVYSLVGFVAMYIAVTGKRLF